jgi:hypothetical protein
MHEIFRLAGCNSDEDVTEEFDPKVTFRSDTFGDEVFWTDVLR